MSAFVHESGRDSASPFILWGQALLDDAPVALSDILSGRGARGAQQRAEPEDFLADLVAHPAWQEQRAHLLEGLDTALLNWLEAHIEWSPARINRFGTRAYAARIADALKVAARLPMETTARNLIQDQSVWDNRFRGLRWPGDIDLLRQFNLVLAQHQTDTRFASRWFAACDEAAWGSPYWQTSLGTGLIGLRKLPDTADIAPESRVAAALARFAGLALQRGMSIHKVQTTFRRRVAALTVLYPRQGQHWRGVWDRALEDLSVEIRHHTSTIRDHWLDHVSGLGDGVQHHGARPRTVGGVTRHPDVQSKVKRRGNTPRTIDKITSDMDRASFLHEDLWERTHDLIRAEWTYASRSGDSTFAVNTTRRLCHRLLRLEPVEQHLGEVHSWTLQAIEAAPGDAFIWSLWAKVLSALGHDDASIAILWESVRRFPSNCTLRNSLANALLEREQVPIMESLLRETMRDFPDDEVCRNMLAKLLDRTARGDEAESLLRETMSKFPRDVYSRNILAGLLEQGGRREEAERLLQGTMQKFPDDVYSRNILAGLLKQAAREDDAENLLRETMRKFPRDVYSRNILAELLEQTAREDDAENLLRETMRKFPRDVYSRNVQVETLQRQGRHDETDTEILTPTLSASSHLDSQSLWKVTDTMQAGEINGELARFPEARGRGSVVDMQRGSEPGKRRDGIGIHSESVSVYLERLKKQIPLLEFYFAPLTQRSDTGTLPEGLAEASELQLVAAHRIGRIEQPADRELLGVWARTHPSSYSARLLLAWQGREEGGLDRAAMSKITEEFPENRRWNNWLLYGFIDREARERVRQEEFDTVRQEATDNEEGISAAFWGGRSSAVYPGLNTGDDESGDAVCYDPAALKRLLEDVAFAGAERALPSVSIS